MLLPTASDPRDEDLRLVERLRAGDERAFDAIVARHRPRLLAFARRILRDQPDTAEDVVQEAFVRAHRALLRDDRTVLLGPWLFKLTRNCALDEISRVKADMVPLDGPAALLALVDADGPAPVHERRATVRGMLEGIATLPAEHATRCCAAGRRRVARRHRRRARHQRPGVAGAGLPGPENLEARRAGDARCGEVQDDLLRASRTGRRASAHAYRHLASAACRAYRGHLRAMRGALHALHPGGLMVLGVVAAKLGLGGRARWPARRRSRPWASARWRRCRRPLRSAERSSSAPASRAQRRSTPPCCPAAWSPRARRSRRARRSWSAPPTLPAARRPSRSPARPAIASPTSFRRARPGQRRVRAGDAPGRVASGVDRRVGHAEPAGRRRDAVPRPRPVRRADAGVHRALRPGVGGGLRATAARGGVRRARRPALGAARRRDRVDRQRRAAARARGADGWRRVETEFGATGWVPAATSAADPAGRRTRRRPLSDRLWSADGDPAGDQPRPSARRGGARGPGRR